MGLLDELTDKDLRDLAALVGPYLKESSIHVENVPSAETLEGIRTLPGVQFLNGVKRTVAVPVSSLKGRDGEKGDSLDFVCLGSFDTFESLEQAFPGGPENNGFFKVGTAMYIWTGAKFEPLNLDVFRTFSLEQFETVVFTGNDIIVDFSRMPYAKATLSGDATIFNLKINNTKDGSAGKILVFQTGFKQISLGDGIKGTVDLPLNADTIALLSYNRIGDTVYMHSNTVLGDIQYPTPQVVKDFIVVYSDTSACTVQWTAPYANNIYDKVTEYDIRYANGPVDADDPKIWNGLKRVTGTPAPLDPGALQGMTISGLSPNKEYYIYLKAVKVNYGISYSSGASDPVRFRTLGSEDTSKAYRIPLSILNLSQQHAQDQKTADGTVCSIEKMVDEQENNIYLDDGYPDTKNKDYTTYWYNYPYGRNSSPYDVYIDLFGSYIGDRLYVYSRSKPKLSVYGMKDFGYPWEKLGEINIAFNAWAFLDLKSIRFRFLKLSFDLNDFGAMSGIPEGGEAFPNSNEYNPTLDRIDNIVLYGRPAGNIPDGIMPPLRRSTVRRTVDQFFCVNGHAYQQGRIHSMCSGKHVRLYISPGNLASWGSSGLEPWTRVADMRFSLDNIGWVKNNNGTGDTLTAHLQNTYKRYGLLPYITFTSVFDYCLYDKAGGNKNNRQLDCYWLPGAWKALPSRGVGGTDRYFGVTYDANSYKTIGRLTYALSAKFGKIPIDGSGLFWPLDADTSTGLDLISGVEVENEPDKDWEGWRGYCRPEEWAAITSAAADGHGGEMTDEDGNRTFGVKRADAGQIAVGSGTAGVNPGYYESAILHYKNRRPKADIPVDVFSMHRYFSITGNQHSGSTEKTQHAIPLEYAVDVKGGTNLPEIITLRDRYAPSVELWLTEFGYGEAGGRDSNSPFQCFSKPGRAVGDWIIPDRHRGDVKGSYIVRASMYLMYLGFDMVNYYSTECESSYFNAGQYGQGPGFEMWHWNDCQDNTPGAKYSAIEPHEVGYNRTSFSAMGLFGNILSNGGFPISRAYWWVATMRNRLKGYVYTGRKYMDADDRIMIYCFKKVGEDKGAYCIYYNGTENTGVAGVEIPVPENVTLVTRVTAYVPEIANPESVPNTLGYDRNRTGMAAARHERYEGGKWVVKSKGNHARGEAEYPVEPQEGDEVVVLPTAQENPYFPIVGAVNAKASANGNNLAAQQYENPTPDGKCEVLYDVSLAWRQVEAVCDYIEYSAEGQRGAWGDAVTETPLRGIVRMNVSEFPEYLLFDAVPDTDYRSEVSGVATHTVSSSAIELYWNNNNTEDTAYDIFSSSLPETGYTLLKTVTAGLENMLTVSGLQPDTTYYYKVRPRKGDKTGTLSEYTSARTYSELPAPSNLRLSGRTATSITLAWDYTAEQVANFVHYAVFRADNSDSYVQVAVIADKSSMFYTDSDLQVGSPYKYKVRAVGLNGQSGYTVILETCTLLPEECPPQLLSAITDKVGTKITLRFDLPLSLAGSGGFTLTEDGGARLVTNVVRDESNHKQVILSIPEDSLKEHTAKSDVRLSYAGTGIVSEYGVSLLPFYDFKVANQVGNFTNMEALYKINLTGAGDTLPEDTGWNNFAGTPTKPLAIQLTDTYGRSSDIVASTVNGGNIKWGGIATSGYCGIEGVEAAVYSRGWSTSFGAMNNENIFSRIHLSGLNTENRYTVRAYGGFKYGDKRSARIRINGQYSASVEQIDNVDTYMTVEDCVPSSGELDIDLISMADKVTTSYPAIHFLMIEEYKSNDAPENTDVYLRDVTVVGDEGSGVTSANIHLDLNCIGVATAWRAGESEESLVSAAWTGFVNGSLSVPYTVTTGYGDKTLYVQVMNRYIESNIRSVTFIYKAPPALELSNVYINNDDAQTTIRNVTLFANKTNTPTHYRASEDGSFADAGWVAWSQACETGIPFVLSEGYGQKTVYLQLKDALISTAIRVDTIEYANPVAADYTVVSKITNNQVVCNMRFDTGIAPTLGTKIEIKVHTPSYFTWDLFGRRTSSSSKDRFGLYLKNDTFNAYAGNSQTGNISFASGGMECVIVLNAEAFAINGTEYPVNASSVGDSDRTVHLFYLNTPESRGYVFKGDFYYCKVWEGDVLVRDFVPVVKKDGVIALLERVTNTLYENMLSGEGITYTE